MAMMVNKRRILMASWLRKMLNSMSMGSGVADAVCPGSMSGARRCKALAVFPIVFLLAFAAGCATNPVTGKNEVMFYSTADEIALGKQHYQATQQAGGGLYTADAALGEYVASVGRRVAAVSDRALPYEFVVVNNASPNAWALPGGKIGVTRGLLLALENEAELAAVIGHEIVHAAAKHGAHAQQRAALFDLVLLGVAHAGRDSEHRDQVVGGATVALQLTGQKYGRDAERTADYHGIKYMHAAGYDTAAAVTLQEKFVALAEGREAGWLDGLFASHPPSTERVANNREALAAFPAGGDLGRARYQERLAYLRARNDAYDQAERARQLLDTEPAAALRDIDAAIKREPRESLFYGIKGDILFAQESYAQAVREYDAAIARGPNYYAHFLGRGRTRNLLGQKVQARRDLERSNQLLPNALASYVLGGIVLGDGERAYAKRMFKEASAADGEVGDLATRAYTKLDIADAPHNYARIEPFFESDNNGDGEIVVEAKNPNSYALRDIVIRVNATVNTEPVYRQLMLDYLAPGAVKAVSSGIDYRAEDEATVEALVLQAAIAD